jgi:hypothetical protein
MGYDPDDKAKLAEMQNSAGPSYMLSLVASLVSAAVLGKIIVIATIHTPLYGMKVGLAVWLGFVTTVQLTNALFSRQPAKLYAINTGYQLVCYLAMGPSWGLGGRNHGVPSLSGLGASHWATQHLRAGLMHGVVSRLKLDPDSL